MTNCQALFSGQFWTAHSQLVRRTRMHRGSKHGKRRGGEWGGEEGISLLSRLRIWGHRKLPWDRARRKTIFTGQQSCVFRRGWSIFSANFRRKGASPTNHCWCHKTRVIALSCGIKMSAVHRLVLSQSTRVTDRQTDRRTDGRTELRQLITR